MPHTPHTPHTPGNAGGNSGPPSVAASSVAQDTSGNNLNTSTGSVVNTTGGGSVPDASDIIGTELSFDPTTVIDTDAGTEALNVCFISTKQFNEFMLKKIIYFFKFYFNSFCQTMSSIQWSCCPIWIHPI